MALKNILRFLVFLPLLAQAREAKINETGTLLQMDSVQCGSDTKSGKSIAGELLGTDSEHKQNRPLLCQEYVLQSDHLTYRIRPRDEKHPMLLPVGEHAQFRIEKDRMKLRVESVDRKERDYVVVSMTPMAEGSPKAASVRLPQH